MRYIRMVVDTMYTGTREENYMKTDMTDKQLNDYGSEWARENAEAYDYLVYGWGEDAESYAEANGITVEEAEAEMEDYYAEASYYWEEISEEEYLENVD